MRVRWLAVITTVGCTSGSSSTVNTCTRPCTLAWIGGGCGVTAIRVSSLRWYSAHEKEKKIVFVSCFFFALGLFHFAYQMSAVRSLALLLGTSTIIYLARS